MKKQKHDHKNLSVWPTPAWVVELLTSFKSPLSGSNILDPQAGAGGILRALYNINADEGLGWNFAACEIRSECTENLSKLAYKVHIGDFLKYDIPEDIDAIISNPPYTPAESMLFHAEKCINYFLSEKIKYLALLLPLAFVCSQSRFKRIFNDRDKLPNYIFPLVERPSFDGKGGSGQRDVCWYVWDGTAARHYQMFLPLSKTMLTLEEKERADLYVR